MENLDYIKTFSKISITKACKKCHVDRSNLLSGRSTKENEKKVREELEHQVARLYIEKEENNDNMDIETGERK